jgi:uncharacterized damage-inducible protein DinB
VATEPTDLAATYLADVRKAFGNYKALAERAIAKAPDDALHTELDANSNSIAVIVKHVAGNLRSRFRDFLTSDGEKPDRHRDTEFEMPDRVSREEMMRGWEESWSVVLGSLEALTPQDLTRTVQIRGEAFLVAEALNRSITHTAYHVGQIVYLARHFAGATWTSLSIPRGASTNFAGDFKTKGLAR